MTPVAPGLWDASGLIGGRDPASGRVAFPRPDGWEAVGLGTRGTLWSWTVQRFPPKSPPYMGPEPFEAFALGYVELDAVIVESRLEGALDGWRVGDAVELVETKFGERATFAFRRAQ